MKHPFFAVSYCFSLSSASSYVISSAGYSRRNSPGLNFFFANMPYPGSGKQKIRMYILFFFLSLFGRPKLWYILPQANLNYHVQGLAYRKLNFQFIKSLSSIIHYRSFQTSQISRFHRVSHRFNVFLTVSR